MHRDEYLCMLYASGGGGDYQRVSKIKNLHIMQVFNYALCVKKIKIAKSVGFGYFYHKYFLSTR